MRAAERQKQEETVLVEQAIEGDRRAFDQLVKLHLGRCYRLARRFGLSAEDAADVVQETFLAAFKALPGFNFSAEFSTWVTRILLRRMSNLRRQWRRARRLFIRQEAEGIELDWVEGSAGADAQRQLEIAELRDEIEKALRRLKPIHRTVFILAELEHMKIRQIAQLLNIPEGTVVSRLHYARRQMRERLQNRLDR